MAFNLFDFSSTLNPLGSITKTAPQIGGATGGGMMPPTTSGKPLPQTPIAKKATTPTPSFMEKAVNTLVPKASASMSEKDMQDLIDAGASDEEILQVAQEMEKQTAAIQPKEEATVVKKPEEARGISTPISGVGAGFVNPLIEISKFSERYLEPTNWFKSKEEVEKNVAKVEKQLSGLLQEEGAKEMPGFSTGKFIGEMVALSAMPTSAVEGAVVKLGEKYSPELVQKAIISSADKFPKLAAIAKSFGKGVIPAAGFQVANEGDVSLGTTALYASFNPLANVAKSLPGISKITGKSEILNAGKIADKQALMTPSGKIVSDKATLDAAARRIAGGSPEQAQKTIDAIGSTNIKKIKTGQQLQETLEGNVEKLSKVQDNVLSFDKKLYKPENTEITSVFKGEVRKVNPFVNALDDLSAPSVMEKLKAEDAVKVQYYAKKFVNEGLSKLEQNDLARIYGRQFDTFKGATPVDSKAGFENTRSGMKDVIRKDMTEVSKKVDKQISDQIATRDVVREINNKVAEAKSKTKFNLGEQVGKFLANILHKGTLGVSRGIARELGGSGEAKEGVMTTLEISKQLTKDLATVKKLSALLDKATTKEEVVNIINSFKGAVPSVVGGTITNK